jgi:hypothetical protein
MNRLAKRTSARGWVMGVGIAAGASYGATGDALTLLATVLTGSAVAAVGYWWPRRR